MSAERKAFFYPLLFLIPAFEEAVEYPPYRLATRKWETSTFDLATLATKHKLHLPYQAMDLFLSRCNMELSVEGSSPEEITNLFQLLRIALYARNLSPFLCPFITTYSINEYSGINSRDSKLLRAQMHPGMEVGLTSDEGTLEAWPLELSFQCLVLADNLKVANDAFIEAAREARQLAELTTRESKIQALVDAATAAPSLGSHSQSILHIWCGLEALFPSVSTEVSFRMALYLAQLVSDSANRMLYHDRVRTAYNLRSQIAHGSRSNAGHKDWAEAWSVLMDCFRAIVRRRALPTEKDLLAELLNGAQTNVSE